MIDERYAYLALTQVPGIGHTRLQSLLEACQTSIGAHAAPFAFLCSISGITAACATAIKRTPLDTGRRLAEEVARLGGHVLIPTDAEFPSLLREIPDPPPVLFALGNLGLLARPSVAIVGSRDHTGYGESVARMVSAQAARAGLVVVSGMARGLDAVAHAAALDAGGTTLGVLGNGLGVIYPAANRHLYERVSRDGLLLTEFPPGERPHAGSFPRRNRLISGLARVTMVVEAALASGALITAGTALDQGREVMAVPGAITSPVSTGCNRLLRDGASPYLEPADLAMHFPEVQFTPEPMADGADGLRGLPDALTPDERAVAELIGPEAVPLDRLVERTRRPVGTVLALLCGLELQGVVEQQPGRRFRRI